MVDLWGFEQPLLTWSNITKQVTVCQPYLVAVCGQHIEVRNMFSLKITQKVDLIQTRVVMPLVVAHDAGNVYFVLESRENNT